MMDFVYYIIIKKKLESGKSLSKCNSRRIYGMICSAYGILMNLLLCVFKMVVCRLCGSKAAFADAVHSLADSLASCAVLTGFAASKYKYAETAASLAVCFLLVCGGIKNVCNAFVHMASPEKVDFSVMGVVLLSFSLFMKIYMSVFNRKSAQKLNSRALNASFADSLCDTLSTSASLMSVIAAGFTNANIDAYCTLAVAVIMIVAGITGCRTSKIRISSPVFRFDKKL